MKTLLPLTTALVLTLGLPQVAAAGNNGHGNDDRGQADRGAGRDHMDGGNGHERKKDDHRAGREDRPQDRADGRRDGDDDHQFDGRDRKAERRDDRRAGEFNDDGRPVYLRVDRHRGLINGCPPGLARKGDGCLPPGQARRANRVSRARFDSLWNPRNDDFTYRYEDGYVYRMTRQGSLLGYMPVLGGALSRGSPWPGQYDYQPVPAYLANYYGLNNRNDYRYADGAVYGIDPKTQAISQVVALLTGQSPTVGQAMPAGYDVYNVPYAYRGQYPDTAASRYRYNDGYVYQVDPKTRLVQAVIQLLT